MWDIPTKNCRIAQGWHLTTPALNHQTDSRWTELPEATGDIFENVHDFQRYNCITIISYIFHIWHMTYIYIYIHVRCIYVYINICVGDLFSPAWNQVSWCSFGKKKKRTTPPMHKEVHLPHDPDVKHPNPILASEQRPIPKTREWHSIILVD